VPVDPARGPRGWRGRSHGSKSLAGRLKWPFSPGSEGSSKLGRARVPIPSGLLRVRSTRNLLGGTPCSYPVMRSRVSTFYLQNHSYYRAVPVPRISARSRVALPPRLYRAHRAEADRAIETERLAGLSRLSRYCAGETATRSRRSIFTAKDEHVLDDVSELDPTRCARRACGAEDEDDDEEEDEQGTG